LVSEQSFIDCMTWIVFFHENFLFGLIACFGKLDGIFSSKLQYLFAHEFRL